MQIQVAAFIRYDDKQQPVKFVIVNDLTERTVDYRVDDRTVPLQTFVEKQANTHLIWQRQGQ